MIAWLALRLGLSQLLVKVILFAVASGGIFLCLRWYGNRQWQEGEAQGRKFMAIQMEKEKQAEWKAQQDSIDAGKRALVVATEQLEKDRANIYRSLDERLRAVKTASAKVPGAVAAIPPDQLDGALRTVSRELAANQ